MDINHGAGSRRQTKPQTGVPSSELLTADPQAFSALSLLADESLHIRRGAAEHLLFSARSFRAIPPQVVARVCTEQDQETVSSLISFLGEVHDPANIASTVCLRFLSDERPGVALDAATALREIVARSQAPIIPMVVLAHSTAVRNDPRVVAFAGHDREVSEAEAEIRETVADCLQRSERSHKAYLKNAIVPARGEWTKEQLDLILVSLCSPGQSVRAFALKILQAYGDRIEPEQLPKVWSSLAFVMPWYEASSSGKQFEYFNALRRVEMPTILAPLVESFTCPEASVSSMARDFSAVFLARQGSPDAAIARTEEMLWSGVPSIAGGAASNLVILAGLDDIEPSLAWRLVRLSLDAAIERAKDGEPVVREFLRAFSLLETTQEQVLQRLSDTIDTTRSSHALTVVARLLGAIPWEGEASYSEARKLLEVLIRSSFDRVAQTATRVLSFARGSLE